MKKFFWVYAIVFILVFGFFMLRNRSNEADVIIDTPTGSDEIEADTEEIPSGPISIEEETSVYDIHISVPGGLPPKVHEQVHSDLSEAVTQFKKIAANMSPLPEYSGTLLFQTENVREYSGSDLRSLVIPVSEYTGGAHGNTNYYTYTFASGGDLISLYDLFEDDLQAAARMRDLATEELLDKFYADIERDATGDPSRNVESEKSFIKGMVEMGVADVDLNYRTWAVDGDEIILIFPPYAVAPYAYGTQEVRIPLNDI